MSRTIDLRRHTDNDGDVLSPEGVAAAVALGEALEGDIAFAVSTGAATPSGLSTSPSLSVWRRRSIVRDMATSLLGVRLPSALGWRPVLTTVIPTGGAP